MSIDLMLMVFSESSIFLFLLILLLGLHFLKVRAFKKKILLLNEDSFVRELILRNTASSWCLWDSKRNFLHYSNELKTLIHAEEYNSLSMEDIFKLLNCGAFSPLAKAVQHLLEFGGTFTLQLTHLTKEIKISGSLISSEESKLNFIFLIFEDITEKIKNDFSIEKEIHHLKSENELLYSILNEPPIALWHRDSHGRITYCNAAYAGALGISPAKIIAENLDIVHSPHTDLHALSRQALLSAEKMVVRTHTVIDGNRRLLEVAECPFKDSTIGYAIDVSEMEDLEDILEKTTRSYKDIFNALSIPIAVFDEARRLSYYNLAYLQLFEFTPRILDQSPTLGDLLEDLRKRRKIQEYSSFQQHKQDRNQLFNNLLHPIEEVSYLPDGRTLRIRISPYPLGGLLFIFENITNQLDLERDVNTLMAVQKTTLDCLREGIIVFGNDGKIRILNPSVRSVFKLKEDYNLEEMTQWFNAIKHSFIDEDQHHLWIQQLSKCFLERHHLSERLYLKDDLVLDWSYVPLPDGSHMLGIADASDEWHRQQKLKAQNMSLELNQKMKNDYIQDISQDLSTLIDDIIGFSGTLKQQIFGELNEKQFDYCHLIHRHGQDLKNLIDDVLESIKIDQEKILLNKSQIVFSNLLIQFEEIAIKKANDCGVDFFLDIENKEDILTRYLFADEKRILQAYVGIINFCLKNATQNSEVILKIHHDSNHLFLTFYKKAVPLPSHLNLGKNIAKMIIESHSGLFKEGKKKDSQWIEWTLPMAITNKQE